MFLGGGGGSFELRRVLFQRFAILDGNLIIVGVYFAEGEKSVPVSTVINKGGLKGGFHPHHFGEIDISLVLRLCRGFYVVI